MTLDQPWKIAFLIALLAVLRLLWAVWREAPARRFMVELLDSGLIAFVLIFAIIRPFVVQAFYIPSGSMEPTLRQGDRLLVNKFIYYLNPPKRGDVIVFDAPPQALQGGEGKDFIKRLIGLPGDEIFVRRGVGVFVNGKLFPDAPGTPKPNYDWPLDEDDRPSPHPYVVPRGSYFVLGDNRIDSADSHMWSDPDTGRPEPQLDSWRVLGKALVVFWPPQRMGLIADGGHPAPGTPALAARPAAPPRGSR